MFISAGASVPGVIWNSICTPSTTCGLSAVSVLSMMSVGNTSVDVPVERGLA